MNGQYTYIVQHYLHINFMIFIEVTIMTIRNHSMVNFMIIACCKI